MKRIEPSRKHGPFDPRWLTVRSAKAAQPVAIVPSSVQAWEGEGGAVLPEDGTPPALAKVSSG